MLQIYEEAGIVEHETIVTSLKNVGLVMLMIILKIFVESVFVNFSFKCQ